MKIQKSLKVLCATALALTLSLPALAADVDYAPVLGKWTVTTQMGAASNESMMEFTVGDDGTLKGVGSSARGSLPLNEVTFDGETLSWKLTIQGNIIPVNVKVDGDTFKGAATSPLGALPITGKRFNQEEADASYERLKKLIGDWEVVSEFKGESVRTKMRLFEDRDDGDIEGQFVLVGSRVDIREFTLDGDELTWHVAMPLLSTMPAEAKATLNDAGTYFEGVVKSPAGEIPIRGNYVDTTKLVVAPYDDPKMLLGAWQVTTSVSDGTEYISVITFKDTPERLFATITAEGTTYEANEVEYHVVNEELGMASARVHVDIPDLSPEEMVFEMIIQKDTFDGEELYSNGQILISGEKLD